MSQDDSKDEKTLFQIFIDIAWSALVFVMVVVGVVLGLVIFAIIVGAILGAAAAGFVFVLGALS